LPSDFVAVKFYFSSSFPDSPHNRAFVSRTLEHITRSTHVVVLSAGQRIDDHLDWPIDARERIHSLDHLLTPATNLSVQTAALSRARAFVGTYGGFSYLAPFYGVDSVAVYSDPRKFLPQHLDLARSVFHQLGRAAFVPLSSSGADVLQVLAAGGARN
jgi:hypothetical protein